jgi:hypothetical protein
MSIENFYILFVGHSIDENVPGKTYRKFVALPLPQYLS